MCYISHCYAIWPFHTALYVTWTFTRYIGSHFHAPCNISILMQHGHFHAPWSHTCTRPTIRHGHHHATWRLAYYMAISMQHGLLANRATSMWHGRRFPSNKATCIHQCHISALLLPYHMATTIQYGHYHATWPLPCHTAFSAKRPLLYNTALPFNMTV